MTVYAYLCPACGESAFITRSMQDGPAKEMLCPSGHHVESVLMKRDYLAEHVGIGRGVRVSRDGLMSDQAKVFLPENKDFAGPSDPDGTKGMRQWRDSVRPKADNKRPFWPGSVERKVY